MSRRLAFQWKRLAAAACLVCLALVFCAPLVLADNCGSPADCAVVPGNIDAATGIAAAVAGIVLFVVILNNRRTTAGATRDTQTDDDEDWDTEETDDLDDDSNSEDSGDDDGLPPPPIPDWMKVPTEPGLPPPPVPQWIKDRWRKEAEDAQRAAAEARKRAALLAQDAQAKRDAANQIPREPSPDDGLPPLLPADVDAARAEELARQAQQKADELDAEARSKWERADPLIGQQTPSSCGVASARMVIEALTGRDVSEGSLRNQSQQYPGAWDPTNGTRMSNISDLLKANGVDSASGVKANQSLSDLAAETAGGHPAIVHFNNAGGGGHFMVVDSVQTNPDGSQSYLVRDPWPPGQGTRRVMSAQDMTARGFSGDVVTTN